VPETGFAPHVTDGARLALARHSTAEAIATGKTRRTHEGPERAERAGLAVRRQRLAGAFTLPRCEATGKTRRAGDAIAAGLALLRRCGTAIVCAVLACLANAVVDARAAGGLLATLAARGGEALRIS
jgi:hypothetical protein